MAQLTAEHLGAVALAAGYAALWRAPSEGRRAKRELPNCGTQNVAGAKFCMECASPLAAGCANCGFVNLPGAKFCSECATPLAAGGAARERPQPPAAAERDESVAERRLVSILFADLVGFTPYAEERDSEDVRDTLSRYFDLARDVIERYGGTVEKFIGDAVMAVWGAPTAFEDDAERAVRAGHGAGRGRAEPRPGHPGPSRRADR